MSTAPLTKYLYATATLEDSASSDPVITISTIGADRVGDRVIPEGGQFANYLKNPVLCWAHDHGAIPIGTVTALSVEPGRGIKASWRWLEGDVFADRVKNAWDQGIVRASSIGFQPLTMAPNQRGMDIEQWELLELSLCAIPMNPETVRCLKSLMDADPPAETKADPPVIEKRGRVLSAVNESRLRAAVTALSEAAGVLGEVLSQLQADAPVEDEPAEESAGVLRLALDEDDPVLCALIDDREAEPSIRLDRADLQAAIQQTLAGQFATIDATIATVVRDALNTATGRVS